MKWSFHLTSLIDMHLLTLCLVYVTVLQAYCHLFLARNQRLYLAFSPVYLPGIMIYTSKGSFWGLKKVMWCNWCTGNIPQCYYSSPLFLLDVQLMFAGMLFNLCLFIILILSEKHMGLFDICFPFYQNSCFINLTTGFFCNI